MKRFTLYMTIVLLVLGATPGMAQMVSWTNMQPSLVSIKAVDAEALRNHDGKVSMGADQRYGQGVVIDPSGVIVTNKHVIGDSPQNVYVILADGKTFEAKVVRNSLKDDMALIKINAPYPLKAMTLGDSSQMEIGTRVFAVGNVDYAKTEKDGEIIQLYREVASNMVAIVQVKVSLNPGDSGGPLVNEQGLLVGLIMANQISDPSKSYAIASNRIQEEYLNYRNAILN